MSIKFASDTIQRTESMYVDYPENILIEPELNGRHEHTEIEDLAADIEKNGQMSPVGVRKNDAGEAVLVYGHRRYRAISLLNERNPKMLRKIVCVYHKLTEVEAFAMAIAENRFRRDVSPIDDAANITMLKKRFGLTDHDVAAIYFPDAKDAPESLKFVKDRAALAELAPEAAQAVRDGRVKMTAAKGLAKLTKEQQRAKVKGEGKVTLTPKPSKVPKGVVEKPLRKLVKELLGDVDFADENKYQEVSRDLLVKLRDYIA
jgi:ParB/RepB/Spo0J family partition protein